MALDLQALQDELISDPTGRGYAIPLSEGAINVVAALLNEVLLTISITRSLIPNVELLRAISLEEATTGVNAAERDMLTLALTFAAATPLKSVLEISEFFVPASDSKAALVATTTRNGSRAEELFGENVRISVTEIVSALALS